MAVSVDGPKDNFFLKFQSKLHFGEGWYSLDMKPVPGPGTSTKFYLHSYGHGTRKNMIEFQVFGMKCGADESSIWTNFIACGADHQKYIKVPFDASADYHLYEIGISGDAISWLVDGKSYRLADVGDCEEMREAIKSSDLQVFMAVSGGEDGGFEDMGSLLDNKNDFPIYAAFDQISLPNSSESSE
eukprot:CAMPEP_0179309636 /NCGR_PEP_ID=MMETSP0797-20121207/51754_1 /TAXON_ID=47934 /ORGANISM="Dinophysis acuminata, Strain DAEP01" /LENGTH=185 /DNA_ID=CAMNT_0021019347 /DNA_START=20 /DNA_END=577 /DNA_ORIENTATION=+